MFSESSLCSEGADVAFILDSSGSLGRTNYERQKIFVKDTMKKLAEKCNLLNGAVVLYSTTARVGINFSHSFNLEFFNVQIDKLPWYMRYTRIDKGLRVAANDVFTTRTGSRPDAPKVAILTTDGSLTRRPDTVPLANASESLKQKGVRIFAIGVGRNVALDELFQITERIEDVFLFNTFSSLIREVDSLVPKILKAIGKYFMSCLTSLRRVCVYVRARARVCVCGGECWVGGRVCWDLPANSTMPIHREILTICLKDTCCKLT